MAMQRYTRPGLPPSPALYFDREQRRAKVTARHKTWRSTEKANFVVWVIVLAAKLAAAWWVLWHFPWFEGSMLEISVRIVVLGTAVAFLGPLASRYLKLALVGFLERQVFATRTTFWFTPHAIALKSRLYARPVVVWRKWDDKPVDVRFILQPDPGARHYSGGLSWKRRESKEHLHESQLLSLLVVAIDPHGRAGGADASQRAIPVTEVYSGDAPRFTMVYAAAVALTTGNGNTPAAGGEQGGLDIDLG